MSAGLSEIIVACQSKRLSNEKIRPSPTLNESLSPIMKWHNLKIRVELKRSCLKQDKVTFTPDNLVIYCL